MNHYSIVLLFVLNACSSALLAQKPIPSTDSFSIEGKVARPFEFSMKDTADYKIYAVDSVAILSHDMQPRSTARNVRGILLKDMLTRAEISAESPKLLSEYYVVCIASDGYKIVFSWNELFNTETGNHVFIVTQKDGIAMEAQSDRISMVVPTDIATGRRHLKGLQSVVVERVN